MRSLVHHEHSHDMDKRRHRRLRLQGAQHHRHGWRQDSRPETLVQNQNEHQLAAIQQDSVSSGLIVSIEIHERWMKLAIDLAEQNRGQPFAAVIVDHNIGVVLAHGVNQSHENPILHGEIVAINNYITRHGNRRWPVHRFSTSSAAQDSARSNASCLVAQT